MRWLERIFSACWRISSGLSDRIPCCSNTLIVSVRSAFAWVLVSASVGTSVRLAAGARLLAVRVRDLPHELGPGHVDGAVHGPGLRTRIVLEDFHHQGGVVGEDHAGLQHAQQTDLSFGLAE